MGMPAGIPWAFQAESQSWLEFEIIHVCFGYILNLQGGGSGCMGFV